MKTKRLDLLHKLFILYGILLYVQIFILIFKIPFDPFVSTVDIIFISFSFIPYIMFFYIAILINNHIQDEP